MTSKILGKSDYKSSKCLHGAHDVTYTALRALKVLTLNPYHPMT